MRIRQGDMVVVIAGNDSSPTPHRVTQVIDGGKQLVVEGINRVLKHVRRGHPKSPQGGRLTLEKPIDSSNVMFYCDACKRGVKLGFRYTDDGAKERHCRKCGRSLGTLSRAKEGRSKAGLAKAGGAKAKAK